MHRKYVYFSVGLGELTENFLSPRLKVNFCVAIAEKRVKHIEKIIYFETVATSY